MLATTVPTGPAKSDEVKSILEQLDEDAIKHNLSPPQRLALLERLKVHGRSVDNSRDIFAAEGFRTICRHAFDLNNDLACSREAQRCIANAMNLDPRMRQLFVDQEHQSKVADRLSKEDNDDEFLAARILFYLTYNTSADFEALVSRNQLATSAKSHVERHAKSIREKGAPASPTDMENMALVETCNLIFNVTNPERTSKIPLVDPSNFSDCVPRLFEILKNIGDRTPPLQQPKGAVVNVLVNLEPELDDATTGSLFPASNPNENAELLISLLEKSLNSYPRHQYHLMAAPLVTNIYKLYVNAPDTVKGYMQKALLPSDEERDKPLGTSSSFQSRLLKLMSAPISPVLPDAISVLLFKLSSEDAATFIYNVGYGNAAGFLMKSGISIPAGSIPASGPVPINPITGQRIDTEPVDTGPPMTDEEKEQEAERLFVLFERLRNTGIIEVRNPVEEAARGGRLEELPDD